MKLIVLHKKAQKPYLEISIADTLMCKHKMPK
jgi:hypothetical protein